VPFLNNIYDTYKNQGFELLGLSVDEDADAVAAFAKQVEIKYPIFFVDPESSPNLLEEYGVQYIPHRVYIDKKGEKRHEDTGFSEEKKAEFETKIKELLKEGG
jgi:peroxiredoxin